MSNYILVTTNYYHCSCEYPLMLLSSLLPSTEVRNAWLVPVQKVAATFATGTLKKGGRENL